MPQESVVLDYHTQIARDSPSVEEQIKALVNREFFTETNLVKELLDWLKGQRRDRLCGRVTGSRRVGKSEAARYCALQFSGQRGNMRLVIPMGAFYYKCLTSCSSRKLCGGILDGLGRGAKKGNPVDYRLRTWESLEMFGVEILLIDNAHFLTEKALSDLIELYQEFGIPAILIGPSSLDKKLEDFDLLDYFKSFYRFPSLSQENFVGVIKSFEREFLGIPEPIEFFEGATVADLFSYSKGNFSDLIEILIKVINRSSDKNFLRFDKNVLEQVLSNYG